jgi:TatD DNase family protein
MIDFHCHLDLFPDPHAVVRACEESNLYVLSVTTVPSAWRGTAALSAGSSRIRTALGLHPELAHEREGELALFDQLLPEVKYVGEVGLDRTPGTEARWPAQERVFCHVLHSCERAGGRVMTIHSRRAVAEVLDALEAHPSAGIPILHWFSGSTSQLARAIKLNCWFSVGPAMLQGRRGQTLTSKMPRDRVLTESDGPFAQLNSRAATPSDVVTALELLAHVWSVSATEAAAQVDTNFRTLVTSIDKKAP